MRLRYRAFILAIFIMGVGSVQTVCAQPDSLEVLQLPPAWSPDGEKLLFNSNRKDSFDLYTIDLNSKNMKSLTDNLNNDQSAMWSADGQEIAFASDRTGNFDLYLMKADGSPTRQLTDHPATDTYPEWSPDGIRLAFISNRDGPTRIYIMHLGDKQVESIGIEP